MVHKLKYVYILFLLIVVSLLVFISQGFYQQDTKYAKPIEFNRVDGYNAELGKISEITVKINNDDAIVHNYTVAVFLNSVFFTNETVEVDPDMPYSFSVTLPTEKQYDSDMELKEDPVHTATFAVYRDDRMEPVDRVDFKFD